jgi:hypothetical protein
MLNLKSKMCEPRFSVRAVSIGFMVANMDFFFCQYHFATAAYVICHAGDRQWVYWQPHFIRDGLSPIQRIKNIHFCR